MAPEPARHDAHLAIVILAVGDVERAATFYRAAFNTSDAVTTPSYVELDIGGTIRVGLYERIAFGRNTGRVPAGHAAGDITGVELYFRVGSLAPAIERLLRAGAVQLSAAQVRPWGEVVAYFADPDGNVVAVATSP